MSTTMSVFCLVETKFNDTKSGTEFGDAILEWDHSIMKNLSGKCFIIHTFKTMSTF